MSEHSLWFFQATGGESFVLQPDGNPGVIHQGGQTIFHLLLTREQVEEVVQFIRKKGCHIEHRPSESQTEEQQQERQRILGKGRKSASCPSMVCPMCFWFDPVQDEICGFLGWPEEMVKEALRVHSKAVTDADACPLHSHE